MIVVLLILHGPLAVALLGAITHVLNDIRGMVS